jgi:hypothetical protein
VGEVAPAAILQLLEVAAQVAETGLTAHMVLAVTVDYTAVGVAVAD